jgi:hypothetical protein
MPRSEYYTRQAEVCLRLAALSDSKEVANHLAGLAADYKFKAAALDGNSHSASQVSGRTAVRK